MNNSCIHFPDFGERLQRQSTEQLLDTIESGIDDALAASEALLRYAAAAKDPTDTDLST